MTAFLMTLASHRGVMGPAGFHSNGQARDCLLDRRSERTSRGGDRGFCNCTSTAVEPSTTRLGSDCLLTESTRTRPTCMVSIQAMAGELRSPCCCWNRGLNCRQGPLFTPTEDATCCWLSQGHFHPGRRQVSTPGGCSDRTESDGIGIVS